MPIASRAFEEAEATIGPFTQVEQLGTFGSHANDVWRVSSESLRARGSGPTQILKAYVSTGRLQREYMALSDLGSVDLLRTPRILAAARKGSPFRWLCMEDLRGRPMDPQNLSEMRIATQAISQLHNAKSLPSGDGWNRPFRIDPQIRDTLKSIDKVGDPAWAEVAGSLLYRVSASVGSHYEAGSTYLHGDLYPHNILFGINRSGQLTAAILDWEYAGIGWSEFDLVTLFANSPHWMISDLFREYCAQARAGGRAGFNPRMSLRRFSLLRAVTAIRQATRCKATANHDEADSLLAWTQELLAVP